MIVGRIVDSLRRLDLSAALVEMLVVIVGIFLGLQVSNWNEDRQGEIDGLFYLELLHGELSDEIAIHNENFEATVDANHRVAEAAKLLYARDWTEDEYTRFEAQHWAVYQVITGLQKPHALKQLVDLGKVDLIRSTQLQKELFELNTEIEWAMGQDRESARVVAEALRDIVAWFPYGHRDDLMAFPESSELILEQPTLAPAFRVISIMNGFHIESLRALHESRQEFRDRLAAYLADHS